MMVIIHKEKIKSNFNGTIIDLETIGEFNNYWDSRRYKDIIPVIFGYIHNKDLKILCAKNKDSIQLLKQKIKEVLPILKRPFHAFQSDFERGVLFHFTGDVIEFESELNKEKYEKKEWVVESLKIPSYGDPFKGSGVLCMRSWLTGDFKNAISHNRSCLLKERDILLNRGFRKPDELKFVKD